MAPAVKLAEEGFVLDEYLAASLNALVGSSSEFPELRKVYGKKSGKEDWQGGDLLVHYQVPLVDGNDVFIESKDGTYSNSTYSTQKWHQNKYSWQGGTLVKQWTFNTDWFAPGSSSLFWEPVYHAALANGFLYDPGQGGTIFKINKSTGAVVKRINPFGTTINPNTFTASPISADSSGNLYYNVVQVTQNNPTGFLGDDVVGSWLVKVTPSDVVTKVSYSTLFSQAQIKGEAVPLANGRCNVSFSQTQLPWPPQPNSNPSTTPCGSQRAALNIAPAIAPDGTIYTVSKAHLVTRYNYLVAVNANLTGKWAASFRGRLNDGCGVSFPILRTKATMSQISSSVWVTPNEGMPVILMPFLTTQKVSSGSSRPTSESSGGSGFRPWPISEMLTPGAPWQVVHISW